MNLSLVFWKRISTGVDLSLDLDEIFVKETVKRKTHERRGCLPLLAFCYGPCCLCFACLLASLLACWYNSLTKYFSFSSQATVVLLVRNTRCVCSLKFSFAFCLFQLFAFWMHNSPACTYIPYLNYVGRFTHLRANEWNSRERRHCRLPPRETREETTRQIWMLRKSLIVLLSNSGRAGNSEGMWVRTFWLQPAFLRLLSDTVTYSAVSCRE